MDVLTLLKNDHKTVGALLERAKKCDPGEGQLTELADEIERALTVHAAIEEKYFYPALRDRSEESDDVVDVFEAYTEHELIKKLIALLKSGRQPDEQFKAEVQVLAENVTHHVEEEESTIFALAREMLDRDELEELGSDVEAEKRRLMSRTPAKPSRNGAARKTSPKKKAASKKSSSRRTTRR
jgi:hemerythrin superfamily protein